MITYPEDFVSECIKLYPNNKKLLQAVHEGKLKPVGDMIENSLVANTILSKISKCKSMQDVQEETAIFNYKIDLHKRWLIINGSAKCTGVREGEYKDCCYMCEHFKVGQSIHDGKCRKHDKPVRNATTTCCGDFKDGELPQCQICGQFVRNLGRHVKSHKYTVDRYKEVFGLNKTTVLAAGVTRRAQAAGPHDMSAANAANTGPRVTNGGWKWREEGKENHGSKREKFDVKTAEQLWHTVEPPAGLSLSLKRMAFIIQWTDEDGRHFKQFNLDINNSFIKVYNKALEYHKNHYRGGVKGERKVV